MEIKSDGKGAGDDGRISAVSESSESIFHSILDRFVGSVNVQHNISNVE
jgi:hypothetical protein